MGNCISHVFPTKSAINSGRKQEFRDMRSCNAKVHPDHDPALSKDASLLTPPLTPTMTTNNDTLSKPTTVKIVVTKKQLKVLLKNVKDLEATGTSVRFADTFWDQNPSPRCRWRPSLDTISE